MKLHRKFIFAILGVALCCTAVSSSALTLGRARGAVLLGQALKLTVPIHLEAGEGSSAWCFDADVFYGDSRQEASRVSVTHDLSQQSQSANVYISSSAGVDEPVVTVYVRAGCENKTTKRYVLLAEPPSDVLPPAKATGEAVVPLARAPVSAPRLPPVAPPVAPITVDREPEKAGTRAKAPKPRPEAAPAPIAVSAPPIRPQPLAKITRTQRAHLKLDPLDLGEIRDPSLKLSNELPMPQAEDLGKRELAAALWRSLNVAPQDVLSEAKRSTALESDLKGLHDITTKNQQMLQELRGRLEQAESQRYANPLVYGLLVLMLLCGLGLFYALRNLRRGDLARPAWWGDDAPHERTRTMDRGHHDLPSAAVPARGKVASSTVPFDAPAERPEQRLTEVDIDLHGNELADAPPVRSAPSPLVEDSAHGGSGNGSRASGHQDFAHSMSASFRSVNTQEMLDVRQQAEFFMTLGQHEEAISLLKESILSSADSNPLVYLDLLKILHTLGRKSEYDDYRSGFNAIFSGHVPPYADFSLGGSGLEAYPDVCQRIAELWPSEDTVSFIESCLVRDDREDGVQNFDLEAFRDLLLLHGIARRIAASFDSGFSPFSAAKTSATETGASFMPNATSGRFVAERTQPVSQAGFTASTPVDVDLSEPPGNLIDFDATDLLTTGKRPH